MAGSKEFTPAQRGEMFQYSTRQNYHMMPKQTVYGGGQELRFDLPKARFLANIYIDFIVKIKIKHATKTEVPVDDYTPYKAVQQMSLDCNNGFAPYTIGGVELAIYNAMRLNPSIIFPQSSNPSGYCYMPELKASPEGEENEMRFTVELPITLNKRDPIGLILLQSPETLVTLKVFSQNGNAILNYEDGYDVTVTEFSASPMLETFSIPASEDCYPDISLLKIVNHRQQKFEGAGYNIIVLPTNTVYRKLAFYVTDDKGVPFEDDDINGNIELIFNQTDSNYNCDARMLRHLNELDYGYAMPKGVYIFDFSNNGIPNLGGTRDFIDTSKLTEFWLKFPSKKAGKVHIILEQLSRMV